MIGSTKVARSTSPWSFGILAVALSLGVQAKTVCVNPAGSGGCEKLINDAVALTASGDTISLAPGVYRENVVIGVANVTLKGSAASIIDPDDPNTGAGITVNAKGVTLKGLSIRNGQSYGVHIAGGKTDVSVLNLNIVGPAAGCISSDSGNDGAKIVGNRLSACGSIGVNLVGALGTIAGNQITGASSMGIQVAGNGNTVSGNTVKATLGFGVMGNGTNLVIDRNTLANCGQAGAQGVGNNLVVTNNKVSNTGSYGIFAICNDACDAAKVSLNTVTSAGLSGSGQDIYVSSSGSGLQVQNNAISGGGLFVSGLGVTVAGNRLSGVTMVGGPPGCLFVGGAQSTVAGNRVQDCLGNGIFEDGNENTISQNTVIGTATNGMVLAGSAATVTGNKVSGTAAYGFRVNKGATGTQLTGNKASGTVREGICIADDGAGITTNTGNTFGTTLTQAATKDCPGSLAN